MELTSTKSDVPYLKKNNFFLLASLAVLLLNQKYGERSDVQVLHVLFCLHCVMDDTVGVDLVWWMGV